MIINDEYIEVGKYEIEAHNGTLQAGYLVT
jgi:hypothetical protein